MQGSEMCSENRCGFPAGVWCVGCGRHLCGRHFQGYDHWLWKAPNLGVPEAALLEEKAAGSQWPGPVPVREAYRTGLRAAYRVWIAEAPGAPECDQCVSSRLPDLQRRMASNVTDHDELRLKEKVAQQHAQALAIREVATFVQDVKMRAAMEKSWLGRPRGWRGWLVSEEARYEVGGGEYRATLRIDSAVWLGPDGLVGTGSPSRREATPQQARQVFERYGFRPAEDFFAAVQAADAAVAAVAEWRHLRYLET